MTKAARLSSKELSASSNLIELANKVMQMPLDANSPTARRLAAATLHYWGVAPNTRVAEPPR